MNKIKEGLQAQEIFTIKIYILMINLKIKFSRIINKSRLAVIEIICNKLIILMKIKINAKANFQEIQNGQQKKSCKP